MRMVCSARGKGFLYEPADCRLVVSKSRFKAEIPYGRNWCLSIEERSAERGVMGYKALWQIRLESPNVISKNRFAAPDNVGPMKWLRHIRRMLLEWQGPFWASVRL